MEMRVSMSAAALLMNEIWCWKSVAYRLTTRSGPSGAQHIVPSLLRFILIRRALEESSSKSDGAQDWLA
jgi:hypothetical protein